MAAVGLYGSPEFCDRLAAAGMVGGDLVLYPVTSWERASSRLQHGYYQALVLEMPHREAALLSRLTQLSQGCPHSVLVATRDLSPAAVAEVLAAGAVDAIPADLSAREIMCHVRTLLRRRRPSLLPRAAERVAAGRLELDLLRHTANLSGSPLDLPPREFDLLTALVQARGEALTRAALQARVWPGELPADSRTLDAHISRLRRKLGAAEDCGLRLVTVTGLGYRLDLIET